LSTADAYAQKCIKIKDSHLLDKCVHKFRFKKAVKLLRMDLCSNVQKLLTAAFELGEKDVLVAIEQAYKCTGDEFGAAEPKRTSQYEPDRVVARFISRLGFDGFATKRQRIIKKYAWDVVPKRLRPRLPPHRFFHPELYLAEPRRVLRHVSWKKWPLS